MSTSTSSRTLTLEVVSLVGLKFGGHLAGDVLSPAGTQVKGLKPYLNLSVGPLSTTLPSERGKWTTSFRYYSEPEVRFCALHQRGERRAAHNDEVLGDAVLQLDPVALDGQLRTRLLDLTLGGGALCGRAEVRVQLADEASTKEDAPAEPPAAAAAPKSATVSGPDAGAGGKGPRDSVLERGFRFRASFSGSSGITEDELSRYFSRYGDVLHVERTGRQPGEVTIRIRGFDNSSKPNILGGTHEIRGTAVSAAEDCERKLFVGGFKDTPPEAVRDYFALFGELDEFDAAIRDQNKKPRGYAFVRFAAQETVDRVLAQPTHTINGRTCTVRQAEARPVLGERQGGAGGSGKGGQQPSSPRHGKEGGRGAPNGRQSRSRSPDGGKRRRCLSGGKGKGKEAFTKGKGGLQIAPGYEYRDGVGAIAVAPGGGKDPYMLHPHLLPPGANYPFFPPPYGAAPPHMGHYMAPPQHNGMTPRHAHMPPQHQAPGMYGGPPPQQPPPAAYGQGYGPPRAPPPHAAYEAPPSLGPPPHFGVPPHPAGASGRAPDLAAPPLPGHYGLGPPPAYPVAAPGHPQPAPCHAPCHGSGYHGPPPGAPGYPPQVYY